MNHKLQILNFLSFLFLSLSGATLFGQSYDISGTVKDTTDLPLEMATVYIQSPTDSTAIDYTITDEKGHFSLKGKTREKHVNFFITFTGFNPYYKDIDLTDKKKFDLGTIALEEENNTLNEVVIQGNGAPIRIKRDTLEFNAQSFKTKADANLEDLLKKLPGVTVDSDGKIKVNGKDVSKIQVNGKDFFGDDPKIATKNLPKDILDKIQVVDNKSRSDIFTGRETNSEDKMINITIKEEYNKGLFARMTAGGGTDHRYSLNGIGNYFKGDMRLSALASSNNINSSGFSFDEVFDAMGRSAYSITGGRRGGGNSGITKSQLAGIDFADDFGKISDLSGNYNYNRASNVQENRIQRENILPDRHFFNNSESSSKRVNNNHRANLRFEYQPDSLTRITFRPNLTANNGFSNNQSFTESIDENGETLNNSTSEKQAKSNGTNLSNRLDITRKYGDNGGYFQVGLTTSNNKQNDKTINQTTRNIFDGAGNIEDTDIQDQLINHHSKNDKYTIDANIRVPLTDKWKLDLDYNFANSISKNERLFFEDPTTGGDYVDLNTALSSNFKSKSYEHRPNAGIVYVGDKLNAGLSGGLESVQLKNDEQYSDTHFDNTYNNLFASFYMRYRINQMKSLTFRYRNSRSIPSVTQLQPITDQTDPLNIVTGNPDLKPSLTNNMSARYFNFNYQSGFGFFLFLNGNYITDQVVARTTTDEDLVRTTSYTNVDGKYDYSLGANVFKQYRFENRSTLKPRIGLRSSIDKNIGYSNGVKYHSNTLSVGPSVSAEYDLPDVINIEPSYSLDYNRTKYSLDAQGDQSYTNHDLRMQITTYWPENLIFGNDITYTHVGQIGAGFDNDYVLWNMSLGYQFLDDNAIVKATIFDVLNQNVATSRVTGEDFIQDSQNLVLKRYMMLSFTYKFSQFGGKKSRSRGRWGGGRGHFRG